MTPLDLWRRYQQHRCAADSVGIEVDISRMMFDESFLSSIASPMNRALEAMAALEGGALANRDEGQMVGHYWLRAPELAPDETIRHDIAGSIESVKRFARDVHGGVIQPERGDGFYVALLIGIGGSSLGPQLVTDALGGVDDAVVVRFIDNTDPDGIERTLAELEETLAQTLTIVVSKSGGTVETRNAMLEVASAYHEAGLSFAKHAVAVTAEDSLLHRQAVGERWLRTFPVWEWVGGRTSVCSPVGLLPAALQGVDIDAFLGGARNGDEATRNPAWRQNPAAVLAAMWHYACATRGKRTMAVIPYRDRLALLGRYLQQLVMESIGKAVDRHGTTVREGLTVYGNKGSTDQHAYVQQLRDGADDFFVTFVRVQRDRAGPSIDVETDVTSGDYLRSLWQGTREALTDNGRESITLTLEELDARTVGALLALFERAVGLYAELIDVNAYHQPGVEAGKIAAGRAVELQRRILAHLRRSSQGGYSAEDIALAIGAVDQMETVDGILRHAAANRHHRVERVLATGEAAVRYRIS